MKSLQDFKNLFKVINQPNIINFHHQILPINRVIEYDCNKLDMSKEAFEEYCNKIEEDVSNNDIVVFMKGSRYVPECGFSEGLVYLLDKYDIDYITRDVNTDANFKEALKIFSDWPTIPMLFVKGELIGGLQITKEMHLDGELEEIFPNKKESDDL